MRTVQETRDLLKTLRPRLHDDFLSCASPFDYDIPELKFRLQGTQYSIYDEAIDAVLYRSRKSGYIVANNTYLSSFAYNVAVVWAAFGHEYDRLAQGEECSLATLLRYNLKKFFAEQLLVRTDSIFARAIFLETLLYEERAMRPLFAAAENHTAEAVRHEFFGNFMSSILLFHEVGHMVQDAQADFETLLLEELRRAAGGEFSLPWKSYTEPLQIEFRCDTFAILSGRRLAPAEMPQDFVLRVTAFAFAVCACMIGLEKSAAATARQYPGDGDADLLDDYRNILPGASFVMGKDEMGLARARSAAAVCEHLARADGDGSELFAGSEFPFRPEIIDGLAAFTLNIVDVADREVRGLCELLARAFGGNPRGMRYLRLRSKVFLMPEDRAKLRARLQIEERGISTQQH